MISLKKRYASLSLVLAVFVIVLALMGNNFVKQEQEQFFNNIKERSLILIKTRQIKNSIWHSRSALENFLLFPYEKSFSKDFNSSLHAAKKNTASLLDLKWNSISSSKNELNQLLESLNVLEKSVDNLMIIRLDARKQYPAFVIIREKMLPQSSQFLTATNLALDELTTSLENKSAQNEYNSLLKSRYLWQQMINVFRMYLSNLVGSLDNESRPAQIQDIQLYLSELLNEITALEKRVSDDSAVGLQTYDSVEVMRKAINVWTDGLGKVLAIYDSGYWRTDADLMSNSIKPNMDKTWDLVQAIEKSIIKLSEQDFSLLSHTTNRLIYAISLLAFIGIALILFVFIFINRILLIPLKNLTNALNSEASGNEIAKLPNQGYIETQTLMDAFINMRDQVRQRQTELEYQTLHDSLTGLPNRVLLMDRLQQRIIDSDRHKTSHGLIMLDLNRFKEINDTLGHHIGDLLLQDVGKRLSNILRKLDSIARLGGDEFAILLHNVDLEGAKIVANKITNAMTLPFQIENHQLLIGCSQGIALYPAHGENDIDLIKHADVAMYVAKRGRFGHSIYNAAEDSHDVTDISLSADLKDAINNNELKLFYQPKVDSKTGKVYGTEALLRWIHPTKGFISPEVIVDSAEQSGLIHPLTEWVVKTAVHQTSEWQKNGIDIGVAVNLSAFNLQNPHLVTIIKYLLELSGMEAKKLTLEVTEGAMMQNPKLAESVLMMLNDMGIKISIDDFGTGYSSLAYLKNLPVHELKIDRSFVMNIVSDRSDIAIVKSTIDLAHNLNLSVVAEGVEDQESWDILNSLECDLIQGYFVSRPIPSKEFEAWYVEYSLNLLHANQAKE